MLKNLFALEYNVKNIKMMLEATFFSSFSANLLAPSILFYIVHSFVDNTILYIWLAIHFIVFVVRYITLKRAETFLATNKMKEMRACFNFLITMVAFTPLLNAYIIWLSVLNGISEIYIFMLSVIIATLSAGSISTLVGEFKVYVAFILSSMIPLIGAIIYHGCESFYVLALILSVFTYIMIKAGAKQAFLINSLISLQDNLQQRVKEEVNKNKKNDELIQQQHRLAQMGEMISMIAHQWRQPLSAITAATGIITLKARRDKLDNKTALEVAEKIKEFSMHLSSTIDDFRNFFKSNKTKVQTDYKKIIESVLLIIDSSLKKNHIKLNLNIESLETFQTYENEMKQVLLNLIKNAEDALIEKEIQNPQIDIYVHNKLLRVSDNAGGISNDIIHSIFDPYFSTKQKKDGTGLGLYMSKTIIEEHCDGILSVTNDSQGAIFSIELT